jgi:extracellular factor (EF) 3-hydroxypalmitic acid methyl ester biosynthesis protein
MDSSAFFQYPNDTVASGSAGNARFLGDLQDDEVRAVLSYTQARRFAPGVAAIREGDIDHSLYVITAGRFEVVKHTADGARRTTLLQPGDIFGVLSFLDHQPSSTDVRAVDDSEVVVLTPTGLDRLRLAQPQLALRFVLHLARIVSLRFREQDRSLSALGEL